jgi:hypothetical protein
MAANSLPNLSSLINSLTVPLENLLEQQLKAIEVFQEILSSNPPKKCDENLSKFYSFICFSGDLLSESIEANKRFLNVLRKEVK